MIGTTDKNKSYHPFGLGVCVGEKDIDYNFLFESLKECVNRIFKKNFNVTVLVADAVEAIKMFCEKLIYCWAHVIRNIDKNLKKDVPKEIRTSLRSDIVFFTINANHRII